LITTFDNMAKKNKYYVVWSGVKPGIYDSWSKCQQNIKGFPGARYKGFPDLASARAAYDGVADDYYRSTSKAKSKAKVDYLDEVILPSWSVDAACSGNPGKMEYQGVLTKEKTRLFHFGPAAGGTNNVGEFLALVHALALLQKEGKNTIPIYTDSRTAMAWVRKKKANTKLKKTKANAKLFVMMTRAENWLKQNSFQNPILKWDTERWGEIPADFGRK